MEPESAPSAAPDHLAAPGRVGRKPFRSAANAPVSFGDPAVAWFVEEGTIDVFLAS